MSDPARLGRKLVRRSKSAAKHVLRRSRDLLKLARAQYPSLPQRGVVSYQQVTWPLTSFRPAAQPLLHTMDFLPDRYSFAGTDFLQSPHVAFAKAYLSAGEFDFKQTRYYQLAVQGRLPFPCRGAVEAADQCRHFIKLIHTLREDGYRPAEFGAISLVPCVDGAMMVVNGKHRLAALLALGVEHFDVFLGFGNEVRAQFQTLAENAWPRKSYAKSLALLERLGRSHPQPERVADLIARMRAAKMETWAEIYHPLPFHEMRHLTTQVTTETPYQRLEMILSRAGNLQGRKVLDLGCNLGFYGMALTLRGVEAVGVEIREDYHRFSNELAQLYSLPMRFICAPLSVEVLEQVGPVDVTLCFSMIQWVIDQQGWDYGMDLLGRISRQSGQMFFDVSVNEGKACLTCPPGEELIFVERLLRENTRYSSIACVGKVHPYRTDTRYIFHCCNEA